MRNKDRSLILLRNCQIKSADKFAAVCRALDLLEIETFIGSGRIKFTNVFVCPDIDLIPFYNSKKPTERLVAGLAISLEVEKFGDRAPEAYREICKTLNLKLTSK